MSKATDTSSFDNVHKLSKEENIVVDTVKLAAELKKFKNKNK